MSEGPSGAKAQRLARRQLLSAALAAAAFPVAAQQADQRVRVPLEHGHGARSFEGFVTEYEAVAYLVTLRQEQSLRVVLATNNAANCFDIYAPDVEKPVYVGGDSGNSHRLVAGKAGDYIVRVFLLRFAARDGQSAQYTLELEVAGP